MQIESLPAPSPARLELRERMQNAIEWLTAVDVFWSYGSRDNGVLKYASEVLDVAKVAISIEPYEADDAVVCSHVDELERCTALVLSETAEWSEVYRP